MRASATSKNSPLSDRKVFCLGLSRTGTTALASALEGLGLKTVHYSLNAYVRINEFAKNSFNVVSPRKGAYWNWAFQRELRAQNNMSFHELLESYDAFADLPFPLLYRELSQRYPEAHFVLTSRDDESWLKSMNWLLSDGHVMWKHGLLDDSLLTTTYGTYHYRAKRLLNVFRKHNQSIRDHFGENRNFLDLRLECGDFDSPKLAQHLGIEASCLLRIAKRNSQRAVTATEARRHKLARQSAFFHFLTVAMSTARRRCK